MFVLRRAQVRTVEKTIKQKTTKSHNPSRLVENWVRFGFVFCQMSILVQKRVEIGFVLGSFLGITKLLYARNAFLQKGI
jgi:hypothetical protein